MLKRQACVTDAQQATSLTYSVIGGTKILMFSIIISMSLYEAYMKSQHLSTIPYKS